MSLTTTYPQTARERHFKHYKRLQSTYRGLSKWNYGAVYLFLGWGTMGDRGKQLKASNYFFFKWILPNLQWIYL